MKPCFFLLLIISLAIGHAQERSAALPADTLDLLAKLQAFEAAETERVDAAIAQKRQQVAEVLKTHLDRETKAGNLETALALKNLISELEENSLNLELPAAGGEFSAFVRNIEMHDEVGWWEVVENELVQHINNGGVRRFPCQVDDEKQRVSFSANGRTYFFKFLADRSMGIRSADDDWPEQLFKVKARR